MRRQALIDQLTRPANEPWDILIIGGGAVGLGAALDAATRGYRTVLVEKHDFCQGTSSRSTKLIHGGVRYLRQGHISLVREALFERGLLLQNAPSIVRPLRFLIPCYSTPERWYYALGLKCYDMLAGRLNVGRSRPVSKEQLRQSIPTIGDKGLRGGVAYFDAQFDDARLALALAATFLAQGGVPINYMRVTALRTEQGRVCGAETVDQETGAAHEIHAKVVVNATGVFSDAIRQMETPSAPEMISPSQGVHLVVDRRFLPGDDALMIPKTKDGRVLFAIPWLGRVLVGTTDTPVGAAMAEPVPLMAEVEYLLEHLGRYFDIALQREDILSAFAGLRPLVKPTQEAGSTSKISREHRIVVSAGGLVSILGGKWTTYRRMAESVVDQAAQVAQLPPRPSTTISLQLDSTTSWPTVDPGTASDRPSTAGPAPSAVRAAVSEQFARTVEDVLARRYRYLLLDAEGSAGFARDVAAVMATQLGHSAAWIDQQVSDYTRLAAKYALTTTMPSVEK